MTARSYLYVPGDRPDMLAKAAGRGADAVIGDLEDAVSPDNKTVARDTVAGWIREQRVGGPQIWIRVNAASVAEDIAAVVAPGVTGISVAKATADLLAVADDALTQAEQRHGMPVGAVAVIPLIETAAALLDLPAIAAGPRVLRLAVGEADLAAELGMRPSAGEPELLPIRVQLVVVSAAAGLAGPVGPVATDFRDLGTLRDSTAALLRLGFPARSAIHPAQVGVINAVLTPSDEEVARAADVVQRFRAAGEGATTGDDGRMIDLAVVRAAQDVLARAVAGERGTA